MTMSILTMNSFAQSKEDKKDVETLIRAFVNAGDQQDQTAVASLLDENYRTIMNKLFGSEETSLMDKATYLSLLESGKIGGDTREVKIKSIDIVQDNAYVKAELIGKKLKFTSFFLLVKTRSNEWKLISDMPYIEKSSS